MRAIGLVVALVAVGCSSSEGAGADPKSLIGTWCNYDSMPGDDCELCVTFASGSRFSTSLVCTDPGEPYEQFEIGVYVANGSVATLIVDRACDSEMELPGSSTEHERYVIANDVLTFVDGYSFERVEQRPLATCD